MRGVPVAALILLAANWTHAQTAAAARAEPDPTEEAGAPGWVFTPSIGVGASHDSNVLLLAVPDSPPGTSECR